LRKKIKRMALITTFEELPHCIVGIHRSLLTEAWDHIKPNLLWP
jgi:hypothetical protein